MIEKLGSIAKKNSAILLTPQVAARKLCKLTQNFIQLVRYGRIAATVNEIYLPHSGAGTGTGSPTSHSPLPLIPRAPVQK
jgi:hypothetical protein